MHLRDKSSFLWARCIMGLRGITQHTAKISSPGSVGVHGEVEALFKETIHSLIQNIYYVIIELWRFNSLDVTTHKHFFFFKSLSGLALQSNVVNQWPNCKSPSFVFTELQLKNKQTNKPKRENKAREFWSCVVLNHDQAIHKSAELSKVG